MSALRTCDEVPNVEVDTPIRIALGDTPKCDLTTENNKAAPTAMVDVDPIY